MLDDKSISDLLGNLGGSSTIQTPSGNPDTNNLKVTTLAKIEGIVNQDEINTAQLAALKELTSLLSVLP
jgi:hypothetical protein